jgi:hypothetical protein
MAIHYKRFDRMTRKENDMSEPIQSGANLITPGLMCARLQRSPGSIEGALQNMVPVITLNGLKYYSVFQETEVDNILRNLEIQRLEERRRK